MITAVCMCDVDDTAIPMRGLTVNLWGDGDPVTMCVFNCNYSQTRTDTYMLYCCMCAHTYAVIWHVFAYVTFTL